MLKHASMQRNADRPATLRIGANWLIAGAAWIFCAGAILPVVFHWPAASERISRTQLATWLAYAAALLICSCIYLVESRRLPRRQAIAVALTALFLTAVVNNIHSYNVDQVKDLFPYTSNAAWQETLQNNVINLFAGVAPHSYRFLPNGIVRWLQMAHVSSETRQTYTA